MFCGGSLEKLSIQTVKMNEKNVATASSFTAITTALEEIDHLQKYTVKLHRVIFTRIETSYNYRQYISYFSCITRKPVTMKFDFVQCIFPLM